MKEISNPFAEIKKVPLYGETLQSSAYAVHLKDEMDYQKPWNEVGIVGKDYMLVSNKKIVDMVESVIDHSDIDFDLDRTFFNGRQFMRFYKAVDEIDAEVEVGDNLGIGVMVANSYDGSTSGRFSIFAYRLLCKNGMMSKRMFDQYRFRHTQAHENWEEELESAAEIIKYAGTNVKEFATICSKLTEPGLDINTVGTIRKHYIPKLPVSTFGQVVDRIYKDPAYNKDEPLSAWNFLNAGTNVLWHKKKQTVADFNNNDYVTSGLLQYAKDITAVVA